MTSNTTTVTVTQRRRGGRWFVGGAIVLLGIVLLLDTTDVVSFDGFDVLLASAFALYGLYGLVSSGFRRLFWPVTFVLVGIGWLFVEFDVATGAEVGQFWPLLVVLLGASLMVRRRRTVVAGRRVDSSGPVAVVTSDRDVVAIFGDARVDFRDLDVETPVAIDAVSIFGTAEVVVPEDWVVALDAASVFGDVKDRRRAPPAGTPDLVVEGVAVFGDVVVRD